MNRKTFLSPLAEMKHLDCQDVIMVSENPWTEETADAEIEITYGTSGGKNWD